jgi:hypothetical protein
MFVLGKPLHPSLMLAGLFFPIEQHILHTNAEKQLSYTPTDVYLTLVLKK